jgi:uncharacterized protein with PIN domain
MLGTLAKKLRILGFDCKYFPSIKDDDLVLIAKNDSRMIITRDLILAQKCKKQGIGTIYLESTDEKYHLIEIARRCNLSQYNIDASNARCTACNGSLEKVESSKVTLDLPDISHIRQFWKCHDCKHVYWEGSHIRNLKKFIDEVNAEL